MTLSLAVWSAGRRRRSLRGRIWSSRWMGRGRGRLHGGSLHDRWSRVRRRRHDPPKGAIEMNALKIFVSSTCYDLSQVRADLARFFVGHGIDPLLSEHASFPIEPGEENVKN